MADRALAERLMRLDMALTEHGTPLTAPLSEAGVRRGNTSKGIRDFVPGPGWNVGRSPLLWVVDRTFEPQTVVHFFQFLAAGDLPGDRKTVHNLPTRGEIQNMAKPPCEWAPAPFNLETRSTCAWLMTRTGSYEDDGRLRVITKELHGMKMRIWEGFPPLSERRWQELNLDSPENFRLACRYIVRVIDVFKYLNTPAVKDALRTTYNLMWDHLKEYGEALNAKRRLDSPDGTYTALNITGMWYQYIRAHYDMICEHAHRWVIQHIDRLRDPIVQELAHHYPPAPDKYSDKQWELTNKVHDLAENAAQADYTIFMPTDGYKGDGLPAREREPLTAAHEGGFREEPIKWSANFRWRQNDYYTRLRYLHRKEEYDAYRRHGFAELTSVAFNDPAIMLIIALSQIDAQTQTRQELRGLPQPPGLDPWIEFARQRQGHIHLGLVAYKLCRKHDSKVWDDFKAKLGSDISDWGRDKTGIDDVRQLCKIHWIDGQENEIADGDIEAARKHFKTLKELPVQQAVFLVIDEAAMESYLEPSDSNGKFLVAVDARYEASDEERDEAPGYQGTLRILGSLLWDELGGMCMRRSISLDKLWPMAMADPERIYRGQMVTPVLKFPTHVELLRWELACAVVPGLVALKRLVDSRPSNP